jgi:peroxiredoxin
MNKKIIILLFLLILLIGVPVALYSGQSTPGDFSKQKKTYAPDFSLKDIQGKTFQLSRQKGTPVVMFFGTTWCPLCRSEMPVYNTLYNKYAGRGLKFLYINVNESTERVTRYAKQSSFPGLVLLDSDGDVARNYSISGVPTLILLDNEGKIIGESHQASDLPLDMLFPGKK